MYLNCFTKGIATMKLALAQISMASNMQENLEKSLLFCDQANGTDLLFFPEIQLSPFFPQYEKRNVDCYCLQPDSVEISKLKEKAAQHHYYLSPNVYLERQGKQFYEQDYYTPSDTGFKVFDTPFGKIGIVICYDRHLPESIRTCTLKGADLIIIPTANTKAEPMEMFEWEMRVQAMQNQVFIAMCNRVGREDAMDFSGESLVIHPSGDILAKADDSEQLLTCEINLQETSQLRNKIPYLKTRRPECYL